MFLREMFGFPPPPVRMETGYDPGQDVVFLKVGRNGVVLSPREVFWLIEDLLDAVDEQTRSVVAEQQFAVPDTSFPGEVEAFCDRFPSGELAVVMEIGSETTVHTSVRIDYDQAEALAAELVAALTEFGIARGSAVA
ncbi:hypothetical protein [Nocardia sp. NPDC004604]|uniref:hypothetical protein n=1 Tax=Nocardia sp. NPDC004604 TaxID=3157013 RepID=UPI0033B4CBD0